MTETSPKPRAASRTLRDSRRLIAVGVLSLIGALIGYALEVLETGQAFDLSAAGAVLAAAGWRFYRLRLSTSAPVAPAEPVTRSPGAPRGFARLDALAGFLGVLGAVTALAGACGPTGPTIRGGRFVITQDDYAVRSTMINADGEPVAVETVIDPLSPAVVLPLQTVIDLCSGDSRCIVAVCDEAGGCPDVEVIR